MKKLASILLLALGCAATTTANAEILQNVTVDTINIRPGSNVGVISFSRKFANTCSDLGTYGAMPIEDTASNKMFWNALMLAYAQKQPVSIWTSDVCGYHNNLTDIQLIKQ